MIDLKLFLKELVGLENIKKDSTISGVVLSVMSAIYFIDYVKPHSTIPIINTSIDIIGWLVAIYLICRGVPKQVEDLKRRENDQEDDNEW